MFARYRLTVHIPRRPYATALPGIPTIRPFEALACGIPLISAPWNDSERLFSGGVDFLYARNSQEMERLTLALLDQPSRAAELARHGRETIMNRHTCGHRIDQLLDICRELGIDSASGSARAAGSALPRMPHEAPGTTAIHARPAAAISGQTGCSEAPAGPGHLRKE